MTADKLAELNHDVDRQAGSMRYRGDELSEEDVRDEIIAGICECATHYRSLDDDGQPVFDFLDQEPTYIVRHAAGKVSSQLRRQRAHARLTVSYDVPMAVRFDDASDDGGGDDFVVMLRGSSAPVDSARMELCEFAVTVTDRLDRDPVLGRDAALHQVWDLVLTGHDRRDIGALLGIRRQRVQERIARLRTIIREIETSPTDDIFLLEVA